MLKNNFIQNNALVGLIFPSDSVNTQPTRVSNFMSGTRTHGMTKSKEYKCYHGIIVRCYNEKSKIYIRYGARGIKVCDRWLLSFDNFLLDMGKAPSAKHSIDRIDVNGSYSPENCRWATMTEQNRNKRDTRYLIFNGRKVCMAELCETYGIRHSTAQKRFNRGMSVEQTFTTPLEKSKYPTNNKKIVQMDKMGNEIRVYDTFVDAKNATGLLATNICKVCRGIRKSAGGYKWKYA